MALTMGERIKVLLNRKNMTLAQLAERLGQSRQNLSNKMSRDNFSEKKLYAIAEALEVEFVCRFVLPDGTDI